MERRRVFVCGRSIIRAVTRFDEFGVLKDQELPAVSGRSGSQIRGATASIGRVQSRTTTASMATDLI